MWLQWGHGDEAVEEADALGPAGKGSAMLQWGHGDEAVEEFRLDAVIAQRDQASMGPRR